jgi:DNA-binding NtrC family response regulator
LPRILSISRNHRLLAVRNDALALAGYRVASPKVPEDGLLLFGQEFFDAVIIGHSVEQPTRQALIRGIHESQPDTPIIFAHTGDPSQEDEPLADVKVDVTAGPAPLLVALGQLLRERAA